MFVSKYQAPLCQISSERLQHFNSLNFCIYILDLYIYISGFIGRLEFPPRMVLRCFLRILSQFNTFSCKYTHICCCC